MLKRTVDIQSLPVPSMLLLKLELVPAAVGKRMRHPALPKRSNSPNPAHPLNVASANLTEHAHLMTGNWTISIRLDCEFQASFFLNMGATVSMDLLLVL